MASSNKIELIDEAFLRPGRFSKAIEVGPLPNNLFVEFFLKEIENIPSTISNQEWAIAAAQLIDYATGAELKGLIDQVKHCAARRCIDEDTEVSLKIEDLKNGLRASRHLFSAIASGHEPEERVEDWDDDDDDDDDEWSPPVVVS
jgi:ATP-dependent 26S proteasome regulatory subunit